MIVSKAVAGPGALAGVVGTIGIKDTLVRAMIHAARRISTPITLIALVVEQGQLSGLWVGELFSAWSAAADLDEWKDKESEGILFVPHAGEILYRVK